MSDKRMTTKDVLTMLKEGYGKNDAYAEIVAYNENARIQGAEILKQKIADGTASSYTLLRSGYQKAIDDEAEAAANAKKTREDAQAQGEAQDAKARADEQALALQESKLQEINKLMAEVEALTGAGVKLSEASYVKQGYYHK